MKRKLWQRNREGNEKVTKSTESCWLKVLDDTVWIWNLYLN